MGDVRYNSSYPRPYWQRGDASIWQLPPALKDFAFRNAVEIDPGQDFDYHVDRLLLFGARQ
jgi:hypothetical protein